MGCHSKKKPQQSKQEKSKDLDQNLVSEPTKI